MYTPFPLVSLRVGLGRRESSVCPRRSFTDGSVPDPEVGGTQIGTHVLTKSRQVTLAYTRYTVTGFRKFFIRTVEGRDRGEDDRSTSIVAL